MKSCVLKLEDARTEANRPDRLDEAESTQIIRRYLRNVTGKIDAALGQISVVQDRLRRTKPAVQKAATSPQRWFEWRKREKGQAAGSKITATAALLPGILPSFVETGSTAETKQQKVDLQTVLDAFGAAVAAIVGEEAEIYRKIMDRLPDELRRRGINV